MSEKEAENELEKRDSSIESTEIKSADSKKVRLPDSKEVNQALEANPDQFPSVANLNIPNAEKIEPFQITDGGKTIAASRKVEQPALDSFTQGLQSLPEGATPEQIAQMQIDYINRKAASAEAAGTMPAIERGMMLDGRIEETHIIGNNSEYFERMAGVLIGSVQGVGNVAVNLAHIADFSAYCILGDKRALEMGEEFGKSLANIIFAGGKLFQSSYDYIFNVGFEGDYSKPFSDIASVAIILNDRWQQLPPREQERRKAEFISQMVAEGLIGLAGTQAINKAQTFTEVLDSVAEHAITFGIKIGDAPKKSAALISKGIKEIIQPVGDTGVGIKMPIPKQDTALFMSESENLGRARLPKEIKPIEPSLENPLPGSLSSVQTRDWYNARVEKIQEIEKQMRESGNSTKEIFETVTQLRNEAKLQARALMKDQRLAESLPPPKTPEEILAKYGGDYEKAIRASRRTNPDINKQVDELRKKENEP